MKANDILRTAVLAIAIAGAASIAACDDAGDGPVATPSAAPNLDDITDAPAAEDVTFSGTLTLDGAPLDARFLGARVISDEGLAAACQVDIPAVAAGRYTITVASDGEVRGCGAAGAEVILWAYVDTGYVFSMTTAPWPDHESDLRFDAAFSSSAPLGAAAPATEFKGHLFDGNGAELPAGTIVEAYAGDTRCAVTSLRPVQQSEGYYTLIVAGPDAVPGCDRDATLSFRLNGHPVVETATNDLASGAGGHELDLTLK